MAVKAIGIAQAAKACGFTKSHVSRVATGQRKSSNTLILRAIRKYVTIVEIPEPEYNILDINGVKNDREEET